MRFLEKTIIVNRDLVQGGKFLGFRISQDSLGQNHEVCFYAHWTVQDMVLNFDQEFMPVISCYNRLAVKFVVDKQDSHLPGLFIECLPFSVGANVPMEDIDVPARLFFFQANCCLD